MLLNANKRIGRTIIITTGYGYDALGDKITLSDYGYYDRNRFAKKAQRKFGNCLIERVEHKSIFYSMPIETFIEHADFSQERKNPNIEED